jgi:hypothetical protein
LTVSLDDESLKKLGIKTLPKVGAQMKVVGVGSVESVSQHDGPHSKNRNVAIQLEKLSVEPAKSAKDMVDEAIQDV